MTSILYIFTPPTSPRKRGGPNKAGAFGAEGGIRPRKSGRASWA